MDAIASLAPNLTISLPKNTANKEMFVYFCFRRDDRPIYFVVLPLYLLGIVQSAKATSFSYDWEKRGLPEADHEPTADFS